MSLFYSDNAQFSYFPKLLLGAQMLTTSLLLAVFLGALVSGWHCALMCGGIAAATGTDPITMGSATCDIWQDSGTLGQITDSTFNETIYNKFDEAVPASARGYASLSARGLWRAVSWSC